MNMCCYNILSMELLWLHSHGENYRHSHATIYRVNGATVTIHSSVVYLGLERGGAKYNRVCIHTNFYDHT